MNGASTDPCEKKNSAPNRIRKTAMGTSHHFLLSARNSKSSLSIPSLFIEHFLYDIGDGPRDYCIALFGEVRTVQIYLFGAISQGSGNIREIV
jgi:hypothetical protein